MTTQQPEAKSYVFKLKHHNGVKEEHRRYGFSGDLRQPAVFSGLYDRTSQAFDIPLGSFYLSTCDSLGRDLHLPDYATFLSQVCDPVLLGNKEVKLDDKRRIVLVFHVHTSSGRNDRMEETVKAGRSTSTTSSPEATDLKQEVVEEQDVEDSDAKGKEDLLARLAANAIQAGQEAEQQIDALNTSRVDRQPDLIDLAKLDHAADLQGQASSTSSPSVGKLIDVTTSTPPAPPKIPLSSLPQRPTPPSPPRTTLFHHHSSNSAPHYHPHLHASYSPYYHPAPQPVSCGGPTNAGGSTTTLAEKRREAQRTNQERLFAMTGGPRRSTPSTSTNSNKGYSPAYKVAIPSPAPSPVATPAPTETTKTIESFAGVKGLLKTFVKDLNRHLADNFGDEAAGFELRLPAAATEEIKKVEVEEKKVEEEQKVEEKVVHRACFCDRCLKTIVGVRHKCIDCSNYDLCSSPDCIGAKDSFHDAQHEFASIERPGAKAVVQRRGVVEKEKVVEEKKEEEVVHAATCDICDRTINGVRHKCLDCPDYDLCSTCYTTSVTSLHPTHNFVSLTSPTQLTLRPLPGSTSIHHHIICDGCNTSPIRGIRYRCVHPDCQEEGGFDLCATCEADPIPKHDRSHALLKLREPVKVGGGKGAKEVLEIAQGVTFGGEMVGVGALGEGLKAVLKSLGVGAGGEGGLPAWAKVVDGPKKGEQTIVVDVDVGRQQGEEKQEVDAAVPVVEKQEGPYDVDTLVRAAEEESAQEVEDHKVEDEETTVAEEVEVVEPVADVLRASFVSDVTFTDGSLVPAGSEWSKIWKIRNSSSTLSWPFSTRLVHVGGFVDGPTSFEVPLAAPGETVEVTAELKSPEVDGSYMSFWRLCDDEGKMFGDRLWVSITVESETSPSYSSSSLGSSFVAPNMHASGHTLGAPATVAATTNTGISVATSSSVRSIDSEPVSTSNMLDDDEEFVVLSGSEGGVSDEEDEDDDSSDESTTSEETTSSEEESDEDWDA